MKAAELCAGYGGLAASIEAVFNAKTVWVSEFEEAPSKILARRWPEARNYGDMTKIDWYGVEPVEVLGGGTPCQDLSGAGKRAGMTEGTRSNLWVNMREAIAVMRPNWVVWENVRGAYSAEASSGVEQCTGCVGDTSDGRVFLRALGRVLGDLSDLGYDAEWRGLRAADVGSCHSRFRVFVLARRRGSVPNSGGLRGHQAVEHDGSLAPAHNWASFLDESGRDTDGLGPLREALADAYGWDDDGRLPDQEWGAEWGETSAWSSERFDWDEYEPAIRRWEARLGRSAPRPTEPTGRNGAEQLSARFCEWMMGMPDGWVTDPAIGISRNEQLKACGNGVVPQQAIAALEDMLRSFNDSAMPNRVLEITRKEQ